MAPSDLPKPILTRIGRFMKRLRDDVPVDTCRQFLALFGDYQNALKDYRNEEEVVGVANPSKLNDLRDQTIELIGFFPELVRSYIWLFPVFPPPVTVDPSLLRHNFTKLYVQRVQERLPADKALSFRMFLHKYLSLEFRDITSKTDRVEELQLKMGQLLIGYPTVDLRENFEKFCSGLPLEKSSEFLHEMQTSVPAETYLQYNTLLRGYELRFSRKGPPCFDSLGDVIRKAKKLLELYPELLQTFGQLIPFLEPKSYLYMALLEKMEQAAPREVYQRFHWLMREHLKYRRASESVDKRISMQTRELLKTRPELMRLYEAFISSPPKSAQDLKEEFKENLKKKVPGSVYLKFERLVVEYERAILIAVDGNHTLKTVDLHRTVVVLLNGYPEATSTFERLYLPAEWHGDY